MMEKKLLLFALALFALSHSLITVDSLSTSPQSPVQQGTPITFNWTAHSYGDDQNIQCDLHVGDETIQNIQCPDGSQCSSTYMPSQLCTFQWNVSCSNTTDSGTSAPADLEIQLTKCSAIPNSDTTCRLSSELSSSSGTCITISGSDVHLDCSGKEIAGSGSGDGIFLDQASNAVISNCKIHGFTNAIHSVFSNYAQINSSDLYQNSFGFMGEGSVGLNILNTLLHDNTDSGAYQKQGGSLTLTAGEAYRNKYGIRAEGVNGLNILDCNVHDNTEFGIYTFSGSGITISDCQQISNSKTAIRIDSANRAEISSNANILGTSESGVSVNNSDGLKINNNMFMENTPSAIEIQDSGASQGVEAKRNNITCSSSDAGIFLNTSSNIQMEKNILDGCGEEGIEFQNVHGAVFFDNLFMNSGVKIDQASSDINGSVEPSPGSNILVANGLANCSNTLNVGGNAWLSSGIDPVTGETETGYSDTCEDWDSDCFCDTPRNLRPGLDEVKDLLPLAVHPGFEFGVKILSVNGKRADSYEKFENWEYVAATPNTPQVMTFSVDSGAGNVDFNCSSSLGGVTKVPNGNMGTFTYNFDPDVCKNATVTCTNGASSFTSPSITFCVDKTAPEVHFGDYEIEKRLITNPVCGSTINNTHTFALKAPAKDNSNTFVVQCVLELYNSTSFIDNYTIQPENSVPNSQNCSIVLGPLPNETYRFTMYALDAAGNADSTEQCNITIDAPLSGCGACQNLGNFSPSSILLTQDEENHIINAVFYYENSSNLSMHVVLPGAPLLVWMRNSTDKQLYKIVTDSEGVAHFDYTEWKDVPIEYTFIYCCFYTDCGFDLCLNASGVDQQYLDANGIIDIISVPDGPKTPQPEINMAQLYLLPSMQKIDIVPERCPEGSGDSLFCNALQIQEGFCIPVALLFGFLLGALYYTGRNPFGIFDWSPLRIGRHIKYTPRGIMTGMKASAQALQGAAMRGVSVARSAKAGGGGLKGLVTSEAGAFKGIKALFKPERYKKGDKIRTVKMEEGKQGGKPVAKPAEHTIGEKETWQPGYVFRGKVLTAKDKMVGQNIVGTPVESFGKTFIDSLFGGSGRMTRESAMDAYARRMGLGTGPRTGLIGLLGFFSPAGAALGALGTQLYGAVQGVRADKEKEEKKAGAGLNTWRFIMHVTGMSSIRDGFKELQGVNLMFKAIEDAKKGDLTKGGDPMDIINKSNASKEVKQLAFHELERFQEIKATPAGKMFLAFLAGPVLGTGFAQSLLEMDYKKSIKWASRRGLLVKTEGDAVVIDSSKITALLTKVKDGKISKEEMRDLVALKYISSAHPYYVPQVPGLDPQVIEATQISGLNLFSDTFASGMQKEGEKISESYEEARKKAYEEALKKAWDWFNSQLPKKLSEDQRKELELAFNANTLVIATSMLGGENAGENNSWLNDKIKKFDKVTYDAASKAYAASSLLSRASSTAFAIGIMQQSLASAETALRKEGERLSESTDETKKAIERITKNAGIIGDVVTVVKNEKTGDIQNVIYKPPSAGGAATVHLTISPTMLTYGSASYDLSTKEGVDELNSALKDDKNKTLRESLAYSLELVTTGAEPETGIIQEHAEALKEGITPEVVGLLYAGASTLQEYKDMAEKLKKTLKEYKDMVEKLKKTDFSTIAELSDYGRFQATTVLKAEKKRFAEQLSVPAALQDVKQDVKQWNLGSFNIEIKTAPSS